MKSVKLDTTSDLCSIYLFRNVTNSSEIKSKLINGEIDATVLNAALIPGTVYILGPGLDISIEKLYYSKPQS